MKIEQIYTGCLSQGAYYIESNGEVAIIDPLRETQPYIDRVERDEAKIKYIFETHFHADFVSGHVTLSERSGAPIVFGPLADPTFDAIIATDLQEFKLGDVTIVVLHTPGHTMESTTYLLRDKDGNDHAIFSGDTLFLGDVGRPDLSQKGADMTQEDLAGLLYDSLRNKIMPLADTLIVYPAHGAGSACGKNMMKETVDTLGNQKKMNYALRADMTKDEFIKELTDGLAPPPAYFPLNVKMNKEGYSSIESVIATGTKSIAPIEFEKIANEKEAIILDVRSAKSFSENHIPRSLFIGLDGSFAPWVGDLIGDVTQPLLLIVDEGREEEAVTRLSRVGFDNTLGYLSGGMAAWIEAKNETDTAHSIDSLELLSRYENDKSISIVDVRKPGEYDSSHIEEASNYPLSNINDYIKEIKDGDNYIHCAGGYRSMIAISILKSRGVHNLINVEGGYNAISNTSLPIVDSACSLT